MIIDKKLRETAAGRLLAEMLTMNADRGIPDKSQANAKVDQMDGELFVQLLEANFNRIDTNGDGISRKELAIALSTPFKFSKDEYAMLRLLSKYFDTIAGMVDDQEAGQAVLVTRADKEVLVQFLLHAGMSLADVHDWLSLNERSVAPPPSSSPPSSGPPSSSAP